MTRRPNTALAMRSHLPERYFGPAGLARLGEIARAAPGPALTEFSSPAARTALACAEVLVTGWGCPPIDQDVLDAAPGLRAIVHAAGSVKHWVSPACWERGIQVSTAAAANAEPVAEFTLAMLLLAGKGVLPLAREYRRRRSFVDLEREYLTIGNYQRRIGLVGASRIGRRVIELLRPFDLEVWVSDPFLEPDDARRLGVHLAELDLLLAGCDIVSLHAPSLPSTRHLIDRHRLSLLPDGAVLINTARGALVDQQALLDELVSGRIDAILDTTEPEVTDPDSPLYTLPNVLLTPHLAGAAGVELRRLGSSALDELARFAADQPFRHGVTLQELEHSA
ncbi:phosphoglycerate dehydrogenase-like enzyme [Streptacidiphilus sp. EB103A]